MPPAIGIDLAMLTSAFALDAVVVGEQPGRPVDDVVAR